VTVPDGTVLMPGETFEKIWRISSSGCAPWPVGTRWVFVAGDRMGTPGAVAVADTPVGGAADVAVLMVAPDTPGTYRGYWQMQTPDGEFFGERVYVQVVVSEPTPIPTAKPKSPKPPSATNEPPAP
jgi:next-to-BRCA1 protein 1